MFTKLRYYLYHYYLNKRIQASLVTRKIINWKKIQTIGIVYDAANLETAASVQKMVLEFEKQQKKVNLLGFINTSNANVSLNKNVFTKKETSWIWLPKAPVLQDFINKPFDVLIYASIQEQPIMESIAALSKSLFRIGPYFENKTYCYDLMIAVNTEEENTLENYLTQIKHHLQQINKHE